MRPQGKLKEKAYIPSVYTLRRRTLVFLALILAFSVTSVTLLYGTQEQLLDTSARVREQLMPTGRYLADAKSEIDLQIQELTLITHLNPNGALGPTNLGQLRLGPAVKNLQTLQETAALPQFLRAEFESWRRSANAYVAILTSGNELSAALPRLLELRQKTELVHRAVDRELSLALLTLSSSSRMSVVYGDLGLALTLITMAAFVFLVWRWMSPLERMKDWLQHAGTQDLSDISRTPPPPSAFGRGILSPPAEVQDLMGEMRLHVDRFKDQATELSRRSSQMRDSERATLTLFAALQSLIRNNDGLLKELIKKEKLASMSEIAAQLAHEIRNPLNSLNLKLELLREDLEAPQQEQLDKVLLEIDRLDALTESHLRTTRSYMVEQSSANAGTSLKGVVTDTLDLLQSELKANRIESCFDCEVELRANVPPNILKAALMNLFKNAREAISASSLLRRIEVRVLEVKDQQWCVQVMDSGEGFSADIQENGIESFKSTKPEGSGLGLVTTDKMLEAYGARMEFSDGKAPYRTCVSLLGPLLSIQSFPSTIELAADLMRTAGGET